MRPAAQNTTHARAHTAIFMYTHAHTHTIPIHVRAHTHTYFFTKGVFGTDADPRFFELRLELRRLIPPSHHATNSARQWDLKSGTTLSLLA